MPIVDLTDQPVTATAYGRWQALNAPLGVTAFGINAIVCDPGEEIDTRHDETDSGQHEVYIAAPDPATPRGFRAVEPGTRVVCIGAVPAADAPAFGEWIGQAAS